MMEKYLWGSAKRQTGLVTHYYPLAARKPCIHSPSLLLPSVAFPPLSICSLPPSLFILSLSLSLSLFPHSLHYTLSTPLLLPPPLTMKSQVQDRFHNFYNAWFCKLEEILHHLLHFSKLRTQMVALNRQHDVVAVQHLVNTTTSHIKQYYTVKWAEAREDVLPFFSPTWLTPLENACSWITGRKPSMVFRLLRTLETPSFGMSEEQARKIEELRMRMRMEEEKVEREMERLQVAMADHKMVELAKLSSREAAGGRGGVATAEVAAVKGVLDGLERTMKGADCVRLKTLKGVLDLLTPLQCVEFLAAVLSLKLRMRQWGKKSDMLHVPILNE